MTDYFKLYLLLIYFLFPFDSLLLYAQSNDYIYGKVINSATLEPVPFATIFLKENHIGLYANADGDFVVFRNPVFQGDSLIVTCIGFNRTCLSFKGLKDKEINKIVLTPSMYGLKEVRVVAQRTVLDPETLVLKAINNIKKNYPQKPFSFVSYYRDYQKKDSDYLNLNEAIVLTNDNGFNTKSVDCRFRLLDFRYNLDFPRIRIPLFYGNIYSKDSENKYIPGATLSDQGGNELFILMVHDAIRNFKAISFSFVNTLSRDFVKNHIFFGMTPVYNNNMLLYKISFNAIPRLTSDSLMVSGEIYIQPKDYSIHKLDYSGFYIRDGKEKINMFNIKIEYGYQNSIDSLMYLKYISFSNIFKAISPIDTTFFRITKSYLDPGDASNSTLIFEFNNRINKESARKSDHYKISFGETKAKIKNILTGDSAVIIILNNTNKSNSLAARQYKAEIQKIKDVNGRVLNERRYIEFYQFRELFVQDYNIQPVFRDSCFMINKPLFQNCISKYTDNNKYWMNSPIINKSIK